MHQSNQPQDAPEFRPDGEGLPLLDPSGADQPKPQERAELQAHAGVPASPRELLALQRHSGDAVQRHSGGALGQRPCRSKVEQVLELMDELALSPWESQQIGLSQVRALQRYHDAVLAEMQTEEAGQPSQVACWAIDADRLQHCRRLLESITLI